MPQEHRHLKNSRARSDYSILHAPCDTERMSIRRFLPPGGTAADAMAAGHALRSESPLKDHAHLNLPQQRDILAVIEGTHRQRIPELVGVRVNRMRQSAYAYYRGTAEMMAADLSHSARSGIRTVISGDAHLGNFGLYASPERRLVFDLNDFDEAGIGPWEWDVKRLLTSFVLELREQGASASEIHDELVEVASAYRLMLDALVFMDATDRYFASVEAGDLIATGHRSFFKSVNKARRRTSEQSLGKIAERDEDGRLRLALQPPLLIPYPDERKEHMNYRFQEYLRTLLSDRALLLSQYRIVDVARRVVGVSSVGTHCSVVLLQGPQGEPLVLQIKESLRSVLTSHGGLEGVIPKGAEHDARHCYRVTESQRILQSASDPFLGRTVDVDGRNFFWRQFRDMKGSFNLKSAGRSEVRAYATLCARQLARAHAQSPDSAAIAGYTKNASEFDHALSHWAKAYADVIEQDYGVFMEAVEEGRLPVTDG